MKSLHLSGSRRGANAGYHLDLPVVVGLGCCRMAGRGSRFLKWDAVGTGFVVRLVGWKRDQDLAGLGGSSWVVRAGKGRSCLGLGVVSRMQVYFEVGVGSCFEKACRMWFGVAKVGIGRKAGVVVIVESASMMAVAGHKMREAEVGKTDSGSDSAGRRQA